MSGKPSHALTLASAGTTAPARLLPRAHAVRSGQQHLFPIAAHILNAPNDSARARILQTLPDALVVTHQQALERACRQVGFNDGVLFLQVRSAALFARRGRDGSLPAGLAGQLAHFRTYFAGLAGAGHD